MTRQEEGTVVKELVDNIKFLWLHRKGNEIPAAVSDVIKACWRKDEMQPQVIKKKKYPSKWVFVISLPPGIGYAEFKAKEQLFADGTGGAVIIEKNGKAAILQVLTEQLKSSYPFDWDGKGYDEMFLPVPIGYSAAGLIVKDLSDAPNLLIAGHPGAGKSNFLHVLSISLLLSRNVLLSIIDLKRLEFSYLKEKALLVSDVEKAKELLTAINKKLDSRLEILESAGVVKIQDYKDEMPFIVLIIDELAEMLDDQCQVLLNRLLRLGRAAGICVVAATQRPSSTMFSKFGDSKAMFAATVCFHVRDELNSRMVLDNGRAALIPNIPGRAIYQWESELEIQAMYLPVKKAKEICMNVKGVKPFEQPPKRLLPR